MPHKEVDVYGISRMSVILLYANDVAQQLVEKRGDGLFGSVTLIERIGHRLVSVPLATAHVDHLLDVHGRRAKNAYNVKNVLSEILGKQQQRYAKKKIVLQKIIFSEDNGRLLTEVSIREHNGLEADRYPCQLVEAFHLSLLAKPRLFVDEALFDLCINHDLQLIKGKPNAAIPKIQANLRNQI